MFWLTPVLVKRLFIFTLIYLPLQYGAVGIIGVSYSEPWPAMVLPGFKNIYSTDERVEILEPRFYVQWGDEYKQKERILIRDLFNGIQPSQLQGFVRIHFRDPQSISGMSPEAREWLRTNIHEVRPDLISAVEVEIEVVWALVVYNQTGMDVEIEREEIQMVTTISLE